MGGLVLCILINVYVLQVSGFYLQIATSFRERELGFELAIILYHWQSLYPNQVILPSNLMHAQTIA
jgi:hypothetical protein